MQTAPSGRTLATDAAVAAGVLGLSWLSMFVAHDVGGADARSLIVEWAEYPLVAAMLAPLAWRRIRPLIVLSLVAPLSLLVIGLEIPDQLGPSIALFLAMYTAGALSRGRWRDPLRIATCVTTMALVFYLVFSYQGAVGFDLLLLSGYSVIVNAVFLAAAWLLGDAARTRQDDERELARRADELAAQQEERARRAVLDERVRIARELHDVVAHHVSVMGVQAAAARRRLNGGTAGASEPLAAVEQSARDAVGELQRLVGFLRETDPSDRDATAPQPTLEDLEGMVAACGLPATLRRVGVARDVPSSVALSAYRIVQEALTNVLRHAGAAPTTVVLTYAATYLQVEVVNTRGTPQPHPGGSGRGVVGMRERTTLLGGHFEHGATSGGGYRVGATLPTTTAYEREVAQA